MFNMYILNKVFNNHIYKINNSNNSNNKYNNQNNKNKKNNNYLNNQVKCK